MISREHIYHLNHLDHLLSSCFFLSPRICYDSVIFHINFLASGTSETVEIEHPTQ